VSNRARLSERAVMVGQAFQSLSPEGFATEGARQNGQATRTMNRCGGLFPLCPDRLKALSYVGADARR